MKGISEGKWPTRSLLGAACFAAMTGVAGFLRIPFFPVPLTLQTLFVYLSGLLLGKRYGMLSQLIFLCLGIIGLPVFTTGGGLASIFQPTFGYLAAFPFAAWLVGWSVEKQGDSPKWHSLMLAHVPAILVILGSGCIYLYFSLDHFMGKRIGFHNAFISGGVLFLPAEVLKAALSSTFHIKIKKSFTWFVAVFLCIFSIAPIRSQTQSNLNKIKEEIRRLQADLQVKEAREITLLEQLEDLDRKIGLQQKLMSALRSQESEKEKAIQVTEGRLADAVQSLAKQRELVARRMKVMYKKGRMAEWEAIASMKSVGQALVWIKYQKMILQNDRRNLRALAEKETAVHRQKSELQNDLAEKQRLLDEVRSETVLMEENKRERKKLLAVVRKEKEPLMERLEQKRIAYQEIETWIAREEEKRRTEEIERRKKPPTEKLTLPLPNVKFDDPIGWPVRGRIVSRYGRHLDSQLKTWTENLGIEIEAGENNSVCAVADGQVQRVDWLRGMGNLVFLDHGGVYTVYGHLESVFVNLGEIVQAGKPIGKVGDRTSFYGSTLHFEVWKGKTHFNPEEWLK